MATACRQLVLGAREYHDDRPLSERERGLPAGIDRAETSRAGWLDAKSSIPSNLSMALLAAAVSAALRRAMRRISREVGQWLPHLASGAEFLDGVGGSNAAQVVSSPSNP